MSLTLTLEKSAEALRFNLTKAGVHTPPPVDLAFDLDVSGSFEDEHRSGITTALLARLVPWGLVFDPDKKLDVFTFSDGAHNVHYAGEVNATNLDGYIQREIVNKVPGWTGGTDYSYVIEQNLEHFGWVQPKTTGAKPGLMSRMFGKKNPQTTSPSAVKRKSIILFVTDGDNTDKQATRELLRKMNERGDQVYIQFIGISDRPTAFPFLKEVADRHSNTGLVVIRDIHKWVTQSDDDINTSMITDELVAWINTK